MELVPVIDLMRGQVVHARGGERSRYRPLTGRHGAEPAAVVNALLAQCPFRAVYIADLDAIRRHGDNLAAVRAVRRCFPQLELWVDAGLANAEAVSCFCALNLGRPVVGSETLAGSQVLATAARLARDLMLSLDFQGPSFLGPADLLERPALWPDRIIVMSLDRVGSGRGPDLERLRAVRAAAPDKRVYAAGGVRGASDLQRLSHLGVAGVLVATALHAGRLPGAPASHG